MAEYILRPALLDKFYKEQNAYYEHGREFSYSFLHGNDISAEWWTIEQMVEDIPAADVRPVVVCANCEHNNHCLTQEFVDDCGKIPLDRNTFFCADGERRSNA